MNCLESIPQVNKRMTYYVVEIEEIVKEGELFSQENKLPLLYFDALPDDKCFDLVFCSSTLQYIKEWRSLIKQFSHTGASHILLSDVFCGNFASSFVTLQNYYESKIPHWFFSTSDLIDEFNKNGYKLALHTDATGKRAGINDFLPMSNFPKSHQIELTSHLLFKKQEHCLFKY